MLAFERILEPTRVETFSLMPIKSSKKKSQNLKLQTAVCSSYRLPSSSSVNISSMCVCSGKRQMYNTGGFDCLFLTSCFACKLPAVFVVRLPLKAIKSVLFFNLAAIGKCFLLAAKMPVCSLLLTGPLPGCDIVFSSSRQR